jgi:DNA-binding transcriptional LysR family regulator
MMSQDAVQLELSMGKLAILDIEEFPLMRHWYLVHRKGKRLSAIAQAFKEFLLNEAAGSLGERFPLLLRAKTKRGK